MAKDKTKRGTALSANMPLPLAQAVYAQVKNGSHDSAGAVIRAALRLYLRLDEEDEPLPPLEEEGPPQKGRRGQRAPDPYEGD